MWQSSIQGPQTPGGTAQGKYDETIDGSEKLRRVEVVGADESAETQHDTPPSPPSVPKPPAPAPPAQAPPGNANSGPGSSDGSENEEAENIVQAELAHNDGSEK